MRAKAQLGVSKKQLNRNEAPRNSTVLCNDDATSPDRLSTLRDLTILKDRKPRREVFRVKSKSLTATSGFVRNIESLESLGEI